MQRRGQGADVELQGAALRGGGSMQMFELCCRGQRVDVGAGTTSPPMLTPAPYMSNTGHMVVT